MKRYLLLCFLLCAVLSNSPAQTLAPLGKGLSKKISSVAGDDQILILIYLKDKGASTFTSTSPGSVLSDRAISRRAKVRPLHSLIDEQDLPLEESYVNVIKRNVERVRHRLKWFNAVSALATKKQIESLQRFPFVREIEVVGRWKTDPSFERETDKLESPIAHQARGTDSLDYGAGFTQVNQINVPAVHNMGINGQGIVVGVFDNGFRLPNHESFANMNIIATYDFIDHKVSVVPNHPNHGAHGVNTLSTIGGYKPGQLIGPAFGASYILARTENDSSETPVEEDNWAAAIEWADSIGVDITSTSLGYLTYDPGWTDWTWEDMDGNTTLITRAADRAVGLGIVVLNSAGNSGTDPSHNTLNAPADGDSVITVGAVTSSGSRSSFSSIGPTTDDPPRIKPDIMAMGSSVRVASSSDPAGYGNSNGTSFSCPISAGVAALVLCANPALTPMQVREALRQTASNSGSPNNFMGWGIINALSAIEYYGISPSISGKVFYDLDADGVKDSNETAAAGALITMTGDLNDSTFTDVEGNYIFDSLFVGNFSISMTTPPSTTFLIPDGDTYELTIDSSQMIQTGKDFAIVEYGSISGSVYEDINGNGTKEAEEPRVSGRTITLTGDANFSTVTDTNGVFLFDQVEGGNYALSESLQVGWSQTSPNGNFPITLNYDEHLTDYAFGIFQNGSIHGLVFDDLDMDGVQDTNETGIAGWTLKLTGADTVTTFTDSTGDYIFSNLSAGAYTVSESLMSGWAQTVPADDGNYQVTMYSGLDTTDFNFGAFYAPNSIFSVSKGWNLLSLPNAVADRSLTTLYPTSVSQAFTFENQYIANDTIPEEVGYWLRFPGAQNVVLIGGLRNEDTLNVVSGWNIVGALSDPLPVSSIISEPDSIVISNFYSFNAGYNVSDTLVPHQGYWVKVKEDGILILQNTIVQKQMLRGNNQKRLQRR